MADVDVVTGAFGYTGAEARMMLNVSAMRR